VDSVLLPKFYHGRREVCSAAQHEPDRSENDEDAAYSFHPHPPTLDLEQLEQTGIQSPRPKPGSIPPYTFERID